MKKIKLAPLPTGSRFLRPRIHRQKRRLFPESPQLRRLESLQAIQTPAKRRIKENDWRDQSKTKSLQQTKDHRQIHLTSQRLCEHEINVH